MSPADRRHHPGGRLEGRDGALEVVRGEDQVVE
jgi:hypothetical protein